MNVASFDEQLFDARRSIRYHHRRRGFYDFYSNFNSALSVMFGSTALYSLITGWTLWGIPMAALSSLIVTVTSTLALVWGASQMARLHDDLYRKFIDLEKSLIDICDRPSEEKLKGTFLKRLEIEALEPPIKRVLDCICYNETMRAQGMRPGDPAYLQIGPVQTLVANLFDFQLESIRPIGVRT